MKNNRKIILIPIDFGIYSYKAMDFAQRLSNEIKGEIQLIHVVYSESWWSELFSTSDIITQAESKLKAYVSEFNLPENTVCTVLTGTRYKKILEYADTISPRYIIMADNFPGTDADKKLGPTLSEIITISKHPIVTVRPGIDTVFKHLLLPLDLANETDIKLNNSVEIAKNYGSTIHLVSVLFGKTKSSNKKIVEKIEKHQRRYESANIPYTISLIEKGNILAYREILKVADEKKCDSILMMTHNEKSFDTYLGTFASHIINKANIPVITLTTDSSQNI